MEGRKEEEKKREIVLSVCWTTGDDLARKNETVNTIKMRNYDITAARVSRIRLSAGMNNYCFTWMLSSALWVQCIMVVKVSVVIRPPRKCWTLMLRTAIPAGPNTHTHKKNQAKTVTQRQMSECNGSKTHKKIKIFFWKRQKTINFTLFPALQHFFL